MLSLLFLPGFYDALPPADQTIIWISLPIPGKLNRGLHLKGRMKDEGDGEGRYLLSETERDKGRSGRAEEGRNRSRYLMS